MCNKINKIKLFLETWVYIWFLLENCGGKSILYCKMGDGTLIYLESGPYS